VIEGLGGDDAIRAVIRSGPPPDARVFLADFFTTITYGRYRLLQNSTRPMLLAPFSSVRGPPGTAQTSPDRRRRSALRTRAAGPVPRSGPTSI